MATPLQELLDAFAMAFFGITLSDAQTLGICIDCKEPIDFDALTGDELAEYGKLGWCPTCGNSPSDDDA